MESDFETWKYMTCPELPIMQVSEKHGYATIAKQLIKNMAIQSLQSNQLLQSKEWAHNKKVLKMFSWNA